jgi:quercetin dioxygenase-like cupin family protein
MSQFVFDTSDVIRYRFPTHTNDLILDRADSEVAEAFLVRVEPGEGVPVHSHDNGEQLFYILEGEGEMAVGADSTDRYDLHASNFVRTPRGVPHSVKCVGDKTLVYLSIDCFTDAHADESTWDSHVRVMCAEHGWDFEDVKKGHIHLDR